MFTEQVLPLENKNTCMYFQANYVNISNVNIIEMLPWRGNSAFCLDF
jgi:hypothetical protein